MKKPVSARLVAVFSACFLTGIFGGLLAPPPYNVAAMAIGTFSFALLLMIGRRVDTMAVREKPPARQWRMVIRFFEVLLVMLACLAAWAAFTFARDWQIDVSLLVHLCCAAVVIFFLRGVAVKRQREAEQKGS